MENKSAHSILKLLPVLFSFFIMGFVDVVGISVSYVKKDFTLNDSMANLLPMLVFLWFAICSLPVGVMMKRIGRKNTVLVSAVLTITGMLIPLLDYSFPAVLMAFALLGIGNTILQVSLNPLVTNVCHPERLASMLTLGQFIKAISSALGPVIVGFAAASLGGWSAIFPIYAGVTALSFVWLIAVPIHEEKIAVSDNWGRAVLRLIKDKHILMLFSVIVLIVGFEIGLITTVPKYLEAHHALSLQTGGYACTLYYIARTIGTFGGAILLAKVSVRKFFIISVSIGILSLITFLLASSTTVLLCSLFVIGLSCANVFAIAFSNAIQYRPEYTDEISSFMIMGVSGGALIPPLMGILADVSTQQVSLVIPLCALVYILYCSIRIKH
ncbi:MAG: MFS transporter [Tannerella sp.]|jgi:fucose permease|nr:MFS transporter [Tannerella sp.]